MPPDPTEPSAAETPPPAVPTPTAPPVNAPLASPGSPVPGPSPAPPAVTLPTDDVILQELATRGIPAGSFPTGKDAIDALLDAAQAYEEGRQYIDIGRQAAPAWDEFQDFQKNKPGEAPPAQPAEGQWQWDAPQFDPAWHQQLDENGQIRPGADPTIVARITNYTNWVAQQQRDFWQDPQKLIRRAVEPDLKRNQASIQETVQREISQALATHAAQQRNQAYLDEQRKELFQLDEAGNERVDPRTGLNLLTVKGMAFQAYAREADADGITGADAKRKFIARSLAADAAVGKFGNGQLGQPGQPAGQPSGLTGQPAPPTGEQQRQTFLQGALALQPATLPAAPMDGTVPRSPTEPVAGQPQSAHALAQELLRQWGDIS